MGKAKKQKGISYITNYYLSDLKMHMHETTIHFFCLTTSIASHHP